METLFHIARREDWREASARGSYRISTLGRTLAQQGYIHLSYSHQVKPVADRFYRGIEDLVVLRIDPNRLAAEVVVEAGDGTTERFPHLYGELNLDAVTAVDSYAPDSGGGFPPMT
jgi:uncharacterized protein (DUF952 family)